jgi:hypothetical protein
MTIYWIHGIKNVDRGAYTPSYEIVTAEPPEGSKKEALPPGYCIDLFKCRLSSDGNYITCDLYHVANLDGVISERLTESFLLERS